MILRTAERSRQDAGSHHRLTRSSKASYLELPASQTTPRRLWIAHAGREIVAHFPRAASRAAQRLSEPLAGNRKHERASDGRLGGGRRRSIFEARRLPTHGKSALKPLASSAHARSLRTRVTRIALLRLCTPVQPRRRLLEPAATVHGARPHLRSSLRRPRWPQARRQRPRLRPTPSLPTWALTGKR